MRPRYVKTKTINLNPPLTHELEERVRTTGLWCKVSKKKQSAHYMIAMASLSDLSISLCFNIVEPIKGLTQHTEGSRCIVCDLFLSLRKEDLNKFIEQRQQFYRSKHILPTITN